MDQVSQQCLHCHEFLLQIFACPLKPHFSQNTPLENVQEFLSVFSSALYGYPYALIVIFKSMYSKTVRNSMLVLLGFFQQFAFEILKLIIKQDRPPQACKASVSNYGMPSGHCTFVVCFIVWYILELIYTDKKCIFRKQWGYKLERIGVFMIMPIVPFARFYLNYHTIEQCIAGTCLGSFIAISTFIFFQSVVQNKNSSGFFKKLIEKKFLNDYAVIQQKKLKDN